MGLAFVTWPGPTISNPSQGQANQHAKKTKVIGQMVQATGMVYTLVYIFLLYNQWIMTNYAPQVTKRSLAGVKSFMLHGGNFGFNI